MAPTLAVERMVRADKGKRGKETEVSGKIVAERTGAWHEEGGGTIWSLNGQLFYRRHDLRVFAREAVEGRTSWLKLGKPLGRSDPLAKKVNNAYKRAFPEQCKAQEQKLRQKYFERVFEGAKELLR